MIDGNEKPSKSWIIIVYLFNVIYKYPNSKFDNDKKKYKI